MIFDALIDEAFDSLWALEPGRAVYLGRHEYDGVAADWSPGAVDGVLRDLANAAAKFEGLDGLDAEQELDRELVLAEIGKTRFEWESLRIQARNPMPWIYLLDPDLYLKRAYAPAHHRAEMVIRLLDQSERLLGQARASLDDVLAETICEWGIVTAEGLAEMVADDVPAAFADIGDEPGGRALHQRLVDSTTAASGALREFAEWLREERLGVADVGYPIGAKAMEELLERSELITMPLAEMHRMAETDLEGNLAAFREVAGRIDADLEPRKVYERYVASNHAERGQLVAQTTEMLEEIRAFIVDQDLITVPSEVRAKVAATPKHLRWAFAMMDTPGPYETEATDAYYYVTPADSDWDDAKAEEWLQALNTFALEDISIHEAYPGHYVHFLHYAKAPTETSRRLASYAFTEGWAHYTEQMMWEEGFREGDPRFHLAQLSEALVRNCRFVCALRLHAHDMSVDEATDFFVANAFYPETPARQEAERGTFDPGYFSYTLGKLQILRLRDDYRAAAGGEYSLKRFHDRLLSRGAPPVELMRRVMLP